MVREEDIALRIQRLLSLIVSLVFFFANASLSVAGNTGRSTILTGRDHGEDGREPSYCRSQTRREARRARICQ